MTLQQHDRLEVCLSLQMMTGRKREKKRQNFLFGAEGLPLPKEGEKLPSPHSRKQSDGPLPPQTSRMTW